MEEVLIRPWSDAEPSMRLEFGIARAEVACQAVNMATAAQYAGIDATLREAAEFPELYLGNAALYDGPDQVNDARLRRERSEFAVRSAVADLAVRLRLSESVIRSQAWRATQLRTLTPAIWNSFGDGDVSVGNANLTADLAATLPVEVCGAFDQALLAAANELPTPRFREKARRLREQLDPQPLTVRHAAAREERRVWFEGDRDGMCWLGAYLPAEVGKLAMSRLDAAAASLVNADGETRTLAQLRADIAGDLLTGTCTADGSSPAAAVTVTVAVTVPVLTLLGVDDLPGTLEGYGPIDGDTARRLAAGAPSFQRILTHPITGTVLDIDRDSYRVPADLKRWAEIRDQQCTFPGCGRNARSCDLDHRTAWQHGGTTAVANLAHLCRHHHRLKHESKWSVTAALEGGVTWTSPTGHKRTTDPPPF